MRRRQPGHRPLHHHTILIDETLQRRHPIDAMGGLGQQLDLVHVQLKLLGHRIEQTLTRRLQSHDHPPLLIRVNPRHYLLKSFVALDFSRL
jgi:hypothetical protein